MEDSIFTLSNALMAYLAVGIAKGMLAAAGAYAAAWATSKFNNLPVWLLAVGYVLAVIPISLFIWPKLLISEKWAFFVMYSKRSLIRQVVEGYRINNQIKKEKSA